jgi:carbonic anhydrase/acetyltransferase-like protein (isoleucine patch superfamily)
VTATVLPFRGVAPRIDPTSFIAPGSNLMGDIEIGKGSSIWLGCQLRGDVNVIRIGEKVNRSAIWCCCTTASSRPTVSSA